ncbi:unnamed protein product [Brassica oleracea]
MTELSTSPKPEPSTIFETSPVVLLHQVNIFLSKFVAICIPKIITIIQPVFFFKDSLIEGNFFDWWSLIGDRRKIDRRWVTVACLAGKAVGFNTDRWGIAVTVSIRELWARLNFMGNHTAVPAVAMEVRVNKFNRDNLT